jgi:hypothetical protein
LNREEFSAIALPRCSLFSTRSFTNECLTVISKPFIIPATRLNNIKIPYGYMVVYDKHGKE